jgi:hypothetical protein
MAYHLRKNMSGVHSGEALENTFYNVQDRFIDEILATISSNFAPYHLNFARKR